MAKRIRCQFPQNKAGDPRSTGCGARAVAEITYQGRKIMVCKPHKVMDNG